MNAAPQDSIACFGCSGRGTVAERELCPPCVNFLMRWGELPACIYCSPAAVPCPTCGGSGTVTVSSKRVRSDRE